MAESEGFGALAEIVAKMSSVKEMVARDAEQAAQAQAEDTHRAEEAEQARSLEFGAFVETAYLIAAADGKMSDAELNTLTRGISEITQSRYSEGDIQNMAQTAASALESEGKDARISAVASTITDPGLRRSAFLVGAALAWHNGGVEMKEGLMLQAISRAFDIPMNEMHQLLGQAKGR